MKIKHKLLLHTTILLAFLSAALILATLYLARQSRDTVLREMQERFDVLQSLTISQFEKAREIADGGISEASSLEAIDRIITTTHDSQSQFLNLVTSEVEKANRTVEQTLIDQADMAVGSLDALQNSSIAFISRIIEDDRKTSQLLSDVSIANIEALENASLESLKRFDQERSYFDSEITAKQNQINDRIDRILADLLLATFDPAMSHETYQNLLVERLETFKREMELEQQKLYGGLFDQLELQQRVLVEEIRLTVKKIEWAIERERQFSIRMHEIQSAGILSQLNSAHAQIHKGVTDSSVMVGETLISLGKTLEEQLQASSGQTNQVLAAKFAETRNGAETVKSFVGQRIADNTRAAQDLFSTAIVEARQVIEASLQASQRKMVTTAVVITAGCAVLGLLLSVLLTRSLMDPIARVVHFAQKLALGDRSERLPEGKDEMGIMSKTLNTMSDELQRLEQATINSFVETLDQVLDCVFMLDPENFRFTYVNQGAVEHLGYEREQLLNMSPKDIATEISAEDMRKLLLHLKNNPAESRLFTTTHRTSSGENIPVEVLLRYVVPPGSTPPIYRHCQGHQRQDQGAPGKRGDAVRADAQTKAGVGRPAGCWNCARDQHPGAVYRHEYGFSRGKLRGITDVHQRVA